MCNQFKDLRAKNTEREINYRIETNQKRKSSKRVRTNPEAIFDGPLKCLLNHWPPW